MPARINLSDETVRKALAEVGGAVSVAARQLGVSTRTLQRRLKEMPHLRPEAHNPLWDKAIENRNNIKNNAWEHVTDPNVSPFSKLWRYVEWDPDIFREARPRQLDEQEVAVFVADLRTSDIVRIEFDRFGGPELRPHLIDRKL